MSDVKHTPGPWIVIDDVQPPIDGTKGGPKHIGTFNIKTQPLDNAPNGLWLSAVHPYDCTGFTDRDTAAANAKLMAASPDLLAAVSEALNFIKAHNHYVAAEMIDKLQTAIDKATA